MPHPSKGAAVFLTLFGLPFLGAGLAFIYAKLVSRENKGQTRSKKGECKQGQKNGSAFGGLGHSLILGAFEGTKAERRSGISFAVHLNLGTGMAIARRWHERPALTDKGRRRPGSCALKRRSI